MCVLFNPVQSTLALLVAGICADHAHHALAADDFAVAANFFDRSRNSHVVLLKLFSRFAPVAPNTIHRFLFNQP
jgi:hypothetical protein